MRIACKMYEKLAILYIIVLFNKLLIFIYYFYIRHRMLFVNAVELKDILVKFILLKPSFNSKLVFFFQIAYLDKV